MNVSIPFLATALPLLLISCGGGGYGRIGLSDAPKVVNVSSYDPKEKQRSGESFSCNDVSALKRNGARGLIARCGKGMVLDDKCADFLRAAECQGMMLGTYYFVLKTSDPVAQADQYIGRLQQIAAGRRVLLVGDFDTKSSPADLVKFIDRVEQRTGVLPAIYLENSDRLRASLSHATPAQKNRICKCPYWIALYSHSSGFETPASLMKAYGIWDEWAMWQYAGVEWSGRSVSKHYSHGPWKSPAYFGSMDRPMEHNAFNGDLDDLNDFWEEHSWVVR
ncbi:MAG: GH25 family lysozyme [Luteolibacter sp.]|uniref:GH25 family lysozyme n=1 Tax=Luteolibacter sp. TaxID=1962973 RepID=UPI003267F7A1